MNLPPIREEELHAYVDGQLDPERRAVVEAYLAQDPEAAEKVRQWRSQLELLHGRYDGVLNEPIPLRLSGLAPRRFWPAGRAAGLAWLVCGLTAGWFAHVLADQRQAERAPLAFAREALAAHVMFAVEQRHPVEVPAEQEAHLVAWLSKRLDAPIRAPDLQNQGFTLLGGRLLPGGEGPLAQLMYESANRERLTLIVRRAAQATNQTGFALYEKQGASVFYWVDRDYGYALSGGIDKNRLLAVARQVEAQVGPLVGPQTGR